MAESIVKELAPMIFQVIAQIPYGRVASYGQIARLAGIPKHARLVARLYLRGSRALDVLLTNN